MGVLKGIGYLVAAVAVLTALIMIGLTVVVVGIIGGLLLDLVGATLFIAAGIKAHFDSNRK